MMAYEESGEDDLIRDPAEVNLQMNVVDSENEEEPTQSDNSSDANIFLSDDDDQSKESSNDSEDELDAAQNMFDDFVLL